MERFSSGQGKGARPDLMELACRYERIESSRRKTLEEIKPNPPSVYYREEKERGRRLKQQEEQLEAEHAAEIQRAKRKKIRDRKEHQRIRAVADQRRAERKRIASEHEVYMKEMIARAQKATSVPLEIGRPTRASSLKSACARRVHDLESVANRRETMQDEYRREREMRVAKRIQPVIDQLAESNAIMAKSLYSKKAELRRREHEWQRWLDLTEQTNEMRGTMLERLFL